MVMPSTRYASATTLQDSTSFAPSATRRYGPVISRRVVSFESKRIFCLYSNVSRREVPRRALLVLSLRYRLRPQRFLL